MPLSFGRDVSEMPYDLVRVYSHKKYLDGVDDAIRMYKEYKNAPFKYERQSPEMFSLWLERARQIETSRRAMKKAGEQEFCADGPKADQMPQEELTAEFFLYYWNLVVLREQDAFFYELVTGRKMNCSYHRKRRIFTKEKDQWTSTESDKTEHELAIDGMYNLMELVEYLVCLH